MEQSVYIIKPEGMIHRESIRRMIKEAGLSIADSFIITVPMWVAATLYPDLSQERGELWELTCQHLVGQRCEIGTVCGEGAPEKLLIVCGTEIDPTRCGPRTIRKLFGDKAAVELTNGGQYWFNVIHRSKDVEEVVRDMKIASALCSSGS